MSGKATCHGQNVSSLSCQLVELSGGAVFLGPTHKLARPLLSLHVCDLDKLSNLEVVHQNRFPAGQRDQR